MELCQSHFSDYRRSLYCFTSPGRLEVCVEGCVEDVLAKLYLPLMPYTLVNGDQIYVSHSHISLVRNYSEYLADRVPAMWLFCNHLLCQVKDRSSLVYAVEQPYVVLCLSSGRRKLAVTQESCQKSLIF